MTNLLTANNDGNLEGKLSLELLNSSSQALPLGTALDIVLLQ